jgi:hypothetical protein
MELFADETPATSNGCRQGARPCEMSRSRLLEAGVDGTALSSYGEARAAGGRPTASHLSDGAQGTGAASVRTAESNM